jgi:drug/metabolite transporter (DMT)-like permease
MASKNPRMAMILWSLLWALALIASAYFFKGNPALFWIESVILGAATFCLLWNYERSARRS